MTHALIKLQCADVKSLELALLNACSEFGSVSRLDIMTMIKAGKRQAVCLVRMDSAQQEHELMSRLGAVRFGEDLCVVVDLAVSEFSLA